MKIGIKQINLPGVEDQRKQQIGHPSLRHARLDDVPELIELAKKLSAGSPMEALAVDYEKSRAAIEKAIISDQRDWLALVSHVDDKPVGVLVAYCFEPIFSSTKLAVEVFWYLDPEYRSGRRGIEMMQAYEYWARLVGCKVVQYGWLVSSPEGMKKLYERTGAELAEHVYYKPL